MTFKEKGEIDQYIDVTLFDKIVQGKKEKLFRCHLRKRNQQEKIDTNQLDVMRQKETEKEKRY